MCRHLLENTHMLVGKKSFKKIILRSYRRSKSAWLTISEKNVRSFFIRGTPEFGAHWDRPNKRGAWKPSTISVSRRRHKKKLKKKWIRRYFLRFFESHDANEIRPVGGCLGPASSACITDIKTTRRGGGRWAGGPVVSTTKLFLLYTFPFPLLFLTPVLYYLPLLSTFHFQCATQTSLY